jgi:ABC-type sugar transport system permease subunit
MPQLLKKEPNLTEPSTAGPQVEKSAFSLTTLLDKRIAYILIAPTLLAILLVNIYPLYETFRLSFTNRLFSRSDADTRYVGLTNYSNVLSDPTLWESFKISLLFTICTVGISYFIGLGIALLLNQNLPGNGILRSIFIIPWAMPAFVTALIWSWMMNDQFGIFASFLKGFGVTKPPIWLGADLALLALIVVVIWKHFPFMFIILLAGLQAIPTELYEAAEVDGARGFDKFWHITFPLLKPVSFMAILLSTIQTFNMFTIPWILTKGGPGEATNLLPIYAYRKGFVGGDFGVASTLAVIIFVFIMVIGSLYLWQYLRGSDDLERGH